MERPLRYAVASVIGSLALLATAMATPASGAPAHTREQRGPSVFAIGDSVMLGARSCIEEHGYRVDAQGSRRVAAVQQVLRDRGGLPSVVVVHTGTNGGAKPADLNAVMHTIGKGHEVIWVTVQLPDNTGRYTFEGSTNSAIRALPQHYLNAHVADWNDLSDQHPKWTGGDGIHLTREGCRGYAQMLANELTRVEQSTARYFPMLPLPAPIASAVTLAR